MDIAKGKNGLYLIEKRYCNSCKIIEKGDGYIVYSTLDDKFHLQRMVKHVHI